MSRPAGQFLVTWPQHIEADIIAAVMVRLDRTFLRSRLKACMVMMIHDSLWGEAPEEDANQVRYLVRATMTETGELNVPLEVDID